MANFLGKQKKSAGRIITNIVDSQRAISIYTPGYMTRRDALESDLEKFKDRLDCGSDSRPLSSIQIHDNRARVGAVLPSLARVQGPLYGYCT